MKIEKLIGCLLIVVTSFAACKKTSERVIDCFGESLLVSVHVKIDAANGKQVTTEVKYLGSKTISGVKWEYGDGSTESTTGLTGDHTYVSAGSYTVKARVSFTDGKSSCEVDPTKNVNIQ
ncbi:PKD domain-containing protein [Pedobacter nyackensis]|uniref:PKD domain-containing protein n=1 Tax=Pedobacter nyackensis TaxID=475255 RepID=UPI002930A199|nr:PKD domain-containing protein [Pedobacter nyackensis]